MKTITAILGSVLILCSFGLAQAQTKDEKKTIRQLLKDVQDGLTVTIFRRYKLGN